MGSPIVPAPITTGTRLSAPPEPNTIVTGPLSLPAPARSWGGSLLGFSRTLDDPGPPTGTTVLVFRGILGCSEPKKGCPHRECGRTAFRRSFIPWQWSVCEEETAALYSVLVPRGRLVRRARSGVFSHARLDCSVREPNGIPDVLACDQRSLPAQLRPGGFHGPEPDRPGCTGCALLSQEPAPGRRGRAVSGIPRQGRGAHG